MPNLLKAIQESMVKLTGFALVSGSHLFTVNWVSGGHFVRLLVGFYLAGHDTVKILSASSAAYRKGFHILNWLIKTW
jgi:hypothetical protein